MSINNIPDFALPGLMPITSPKEEARAAVIRLMWGEAWQDTWDLNDMVGDDVDLSGATILVELLRADYTAAGTVTAVRTAPDSLTLSMAVDAVKTLIDDWTGPWPRWRLTVTRPSLPTLGAEGPVTFTKLPYHPGILC